MRRAPVLLAALSLLVAETGRARSTPPPALPAARTAVVAGRLAPARGTEDRFVLRVVTAGVSGYPELVHEETIEPGSFRVRFPCPEVPYAVLITAGDHAPFVRRFRAGRREARLKDPVVPVPWVEERLRVLRGERPVAGEDVLVLRAGEVATDLPMHPWLERSGRTAEDGSATLRLGPAVRGIWLEVGHERRFLTEEDRGADGVFTWNLRDSRILRIGAVRASDREPIDPERIRLLGWRRGGKDWMPLPLQGGERGRWIVRPEGLVAVRFEVEGCRPVEVRGADLESPGPRRLSVSVRDTRVERVEARLTVSVAGLRSARRAGKPAWCGTCGWTRPIPARVDIRALAAGAATRVPGGNSGSTRFPPVRTRRDLPPGRYEVRVQGPLGLPRVRLLDLPPGTDVRMHVSVAGGAAIRLVVRERSGRAAREVAFRVLDARGRPVRAEYGPDDPTGSPRWIAERDGFENVPNGGLIRLPPGSWRVEVRRQNGEAQTLTARTYAGAITRLEVRPPGRGRVRLD